MCCGRLLADIRIEGVSESDPSRHLELPATPSAARMARGFVGQATDELSPEVADAAAVCTSELVTNGVLHARTALVLGVTLSPQRLLVTVADKATTRPQQVPPDDERPSGRGLVLVSALAADWGVHEDDDGKTVWFAIDRPPS